MAEHVAQVDDLGLAGGVVSTVRPSASTAAVGMFSVAPTDGIS